MMQAAISQTNLLPTLAHLNALEAERLSPAATLSEEALRRKEEKRIGYRQSFALDADRIIHSRAYTRYIDKTQVFCLIANDHITHRVLHVQLVSRIARTIGRFLALNEDLIEAIALGHDIGHPPSVTTENTFWPSSALDTTSHLFNITFSLFVFSIALNAREEDGISAYRPLTESSATTAKSMRTDFLLSQPKILRHWIGTWKAKEPTPDSNSPP